MIEKCSNLKVYQSSEKEDPGDETNFNKDHCGFFLCKKYCFFKMENLEACSSGSIAPAKTEVYLFTRRTVENKAY